MIEINNLSIWIGARQILNDINLKISKGETLAIIGPSGCGKSTLLRNIIGLQKPTSGTIFVKGNNVTALKEKEQYEIRKSIGMVFQGAALFDSMTVKENVAFPLRQHAKKTETEIAEIVAEKLKLVGLPGIENLMPAELSGGMQKRVGLARAIALDPEIILYDEPTAGLDPLMSRTINNLIIELQQKLGVTSVVVTHYMESAFRIADKVAILLDKQLMEYGTPDEIKATRKLKVREFIEA